MTLVLLVLSALAGRYAGSIAGYAAGREEVLAAHYGKKGLGGDAGH